jgi:hypothetical protein
MLITFIYNNFKQTGNLMKKTNFFFILISSLLILQFSCIPTSFAVPKAITSPNSSQVPISPIRIAIYDEPDLSHPSYSSVGLLTNNNTLINSILNSAGYDVSYLNVVDISNHKLITANYDVFIINDNLPRDNITDYVKEFWLGGGSLLTFDSAVSFLCYFGILPPESNGDEGFGTYWNYIWSDNQTILTRHPVSKAYEISDGFSVRYFDWATFDWTALLGTSIAGQLTPIATIDGDTNSITVLGFDPEAQGGKIVHICGSEEFSANKLLIDAIDWLCPRPKGRIAFDMTHNPRLGVDSWDDLATFPGYYTTWRDDLVSRGYLFDKIYPSASGNLTLTRLNHYDVLILLSPDANYSSSDRSALTSWVNTGGSLLVFGDNPLLSDFAITNARINFLLNSFGIKVSESIGFGGSVNLVGEEHPSVEGCVNLNLDARAAVNLTGNAYPIWKDGVHNIVAGQESQSGRIIVVGDMNWCTDAQIANGDNAEVLIFIHNPSIPDPNDNIYRGPVANALNDLGCPFYMTFTKEYLNLSLSTGSYKLVVIDNSEYSIMDTVGTTLLNFLKAGGYMIISTYEYRLATYNYLWDYIGFTYAGNYFTTPQSINIWNPSHSIFSSPVPYGASTLNTSLDFLNTDYTNLTLHANATAIAGLTSTPQIDGSAIIIGANKHAITNAMQLTEYFDDTDDDTYPDALQLWANEISYMLTQAHPSTTTPGIPGYDTFIITFSIFFTISLISLITIHKRKHIII